MSALPSFSTSSERLSGKAPAQHPGLEKHHRFPGNWPRCFLVLVSSFYKASESSLHAADPQWGWIQTIHWPLSHSKTMYKNPFPLKRSKKILSRYLLSTESWKLHLHASEPGPDLFCLSQKPINWSKNRSVTESPRPCRRCTYHLKEIQGSGAYPH